MAKAPTEMTEIKLLCADCEHFKPIPFTDMGECGLLRILTDSEHDRCKYNKLKETTKERKKNG